MLIISRLLFIAKKKLIHCQANNIAVLLQQIDSMHRGLSPSYGLLYILLSCCSRQHSADSALYFNVVKLKMDSFFYKVSKVFQPE